MAAPPTVDLTQGLGTVDDPVSVLSQPASPVPQTAKEEQKSDSAKWEEHKSKEILKHHLEGPVAVGVAEETGRTVNPYEGVWRVASLALERQNVTIWSADGDKPPPSVAAVCGEDPGANGPAGFYMFYQRNAADPPYPIRADAEEKRAGIKERRSPYYVDPTGQVKLNGTAAAYRWATYAPDMKYIIVKRKGRIGRSMRF